MLSKRALNEEAISVHLAAAVLYARGIVQDFSGLAVYDSHLENF